MSRDPGHTRFSKTKIMDHVRTALGSMRVDFEVSGFNYRLWAFNIQTGYWSD